MPELVFVRRANNKRGQRKLSSLIETSAAAAARIAERRSQLIYR
jgi:hypothetical protein